MERQIPKMQINMPLVTSELFFSAPETSEQQVEAPSETHAPRETQLIPSISSETEAQCTGEPLVAADEDQVDPDADIYVDLSKELAAIEGIHATSFCNAPAGRMPRRAHAFAPCTPFQSSNQAESTHLASAQKAEPQTSDAIASSSRLKHRNNFTESCLHQAEPTLTLWSTRREDRLSTGLVDTAGTESRDPLSFAVSCGLYKENLHSHHSSHLKKKVNDTADEESSEGSEGHTDSDIASLLGSVEQARQRLRMQEAAEDKLDAALYAGGLFQFSRSAATTTTLLTRESTTVTPAPSQRAGETAPILGAEEACAPAASTGNGHKSKEPHLVLSSQKSPAETIKPPHGAILRATPQPGAAERSGMTREGFTALLTFNQASSICETNKCTTAPGVGGGIAAEMRRNSLLSAEVADLKEELRNTREELEKVRSRAHICYRIHRLVLDWRDSEAIAEAQQKHLGDNLDGEEAAAQKCLREIESVFVKGIKEGDLQAQETAGLQQELTTCREGLRKAELQCESLRNEISFLQLVNKKLKERREEEQSNAFEELKRHLDRKTKEAAEVQDEMETLRREHDNLKSHFAEQLAAADSARAAIYQELSATRHVSDLKMTDLEETVERLRNENKQLRAHKEAAESRLRECAQAERLAQIERDEMKRKQAKLAAQHEALKKSLHEIRVSAAEARRKWHSSYKQDRDEPDNDSNRDANRDTTLQEPLGRNTLSLSSLSNEVLPPEAAGGSALGRPKAFQVADTYGCALSTAASGDILLRKCSSPAQAEGEGKEEVHMDISSFQREMSRESLSGHDNEVSTQPRPNFGTYIDPSVQWRHKSEPVVDSGNSLEETETAGPAATSLSLCRETETSSSIDASGSSRGRTCKKRQKGIRTSANKDWRSGVADNTSDGGRPTEPLDKPTQAFDPRLCAVDTDGVPSCSGGQAARGGSSERPVIPSVSHSGVSGFQTDPVFCTEFRMSSNVRFNTSIALPSSVSMGIEASDAGAGSSPTCMYTSKLQEVEEANDMLRRTNEIVDEENARLRQAILGAAVTLSPTEIGRVTNGLSNPTAVRANGSLTTFDSLALSSASQDEGTKEKNSHRVFERPANAAGERKDLREVLRRDTGKWANETHQREKHFLGADSSTKCSLTRSFSCPPSTWQRFFPLQELKQPLESVTAQQQPSSAAQSHATEVCMTETANKNQDGNSIEMSKPETVATVINPEKGSCKAPTVHTYCGITVGQITGKNNGNSSGKAGDNKTPQPSPHKTATNGGQPVVTGLKVVQQQQIAVGPVLDKPKEGQQKQQQSGEPEGEVENHSRPAKPKNFTGRESAAASATGPKKAHASAATSSACGLSAKSLTEPTDVSSAYLSPGNPIGVEKGASCTSSLTTPRQSRPSYAVSAPSVELRGEVTWHIPAETGLQTPTSQNGTPSQVSKVPDPNRDNQCSNCHFSAVEEVCGGTSAAAVVDFQNSLFSGPAKLGESKRLSTVVEEVKGNADGCDAYNDEFDSPILGCPSDSRSALSEPQTSRNSPSERNLECEKIRSGHELSEKQITDVHSATESAQLLVAEAGRSFKLKFLQHRRETGCLYLENGHSRKTPTNVSVSSPAKESRGPIIAMASRQQKGELCLLSPTLLFSRTSNGSCLSSSRRCEACIATACDRIFAEATPTEAAAICRLASPARRALSGEELFRESNTSPAAAPRKIRSPRRTNGAAGEVAPTEALLSPSKATIKKHNFTNKAIHESGKLNSACAQNEAERKSLVLPADARELIWLLSRQLPQLGCKEAFVASHKRPEACTVRKPSDSSSRHCHTSNSNPRQLPSCIQKLPGRTQQAKANTVSPATPRLSSKACQERFPLGVRKSRSKCERSEKGSLTVKKEQTRVMNLPMAAQVPSVAKPCISKHSASTASERRAASAGGRPVNMSRHGNAKQTSINEAILRSATPAVHSRQSTVASACKGTKGRGEKPPWDSSSVPLHGGPRMPFRTLLKRKDTK